MHWNRTRSTSLATLFALGSLIVSGCGTTNTLNPPSNQAQNETTQQPTENANATLNANATFNATAGSNTTRGANQAAGSGAGTSNQTAMSDSSGPLVAGRKAPDFTLTNLNGKSISLQQLLAAGKPVLINAWASWCPPCKMETPDLIQASKKYGDKIQFVGVNLTTMDSVKEAKAFVSHYGIPYPILLDTKGQFLDRYTVIAEPMTFLISPQGTVLKINLGMMTSAQMDQFIQSVI